MGAPARPAPPPPPPPPPAVDTATAETTGAESEAEKKRRRSMVERRAAGREGTILTSGLGTGGPTGGVMGKTLLGG